MKHLKYFENKQDSPQNGDYALVKIEHDNKEFEHFCNNNI